MISKLSGKEISVRKIFQIVLVLVGSKALLKIGQSIKKRIYEKQINKKSLLYNQTNKERLRQIEVDHRGNIQNEKIVQQVLNSTVVELKQMLKSNIITSQDLVNIFTSRALSIGIDLNIVTEINYDEAIQLAAQYDSLIQRNPEIVDQKPLFGIPISIKDSIDQKGYASTLGVFRRTTEIKEKEALVMTLIRDAGGIPFIRTNIPQFTMSYESSNKLFGAVQNPWDTSKMAGGSSGGEGSAIAARVSPIGIGTDIGGSIRIPAAMNGIYGFKPTVGRIPLSGSTYYSPILAGKTIIRSVCGPMGKDVNDLVLLMQALTNTKKIQQLPVTEQDVQNVVFPFNLTTYLDRTKKMRIGYFKTLDYYDATVSNQRAVDIAVKELTKKGHELVEISIPFAKDILQTFITHACCDKLEGYQDILGDKEAFAEEFNKIISSVSLSKLTRLIVIKLLKLFGQHRLADVCAWGKKLSAADYLRNCDAVIKLRTKTVELFQEQQIEAIISPSFAHPAVAHNFCHVSTINAIYTILWNVINLPSGVIPVTLVKEDEQHYSNSRVKDNLARLLDQRMKDHTAGLPVGVMVATLPFQDELCLNIMKQLEDSIQFYNHNQYPL